MFTSAEAQTNFNSRKWGWERSPCTSYQRRPPERGRLVQSVGAHPSFGTRPQSPDTAFFGLSCPRPSSWKCGSCTQTVGLEQEQRRQSRAGEAASVCFEPSSLMFSECYFTILCGHLSFLSVSEVFLQFAFIVERFLLLSCHPV